ncbi:MAG TPA: DNA-processing protein DprA [Povalibacter sp.]|uniref:DNA-processing protein DprA n=1 Tax=Povalibacter sp. TaxID=1962978 RepID=UPI002CD7883E|nr:DNA-processing protein DprA [Povalibacter sp.]HMN45214.1 DNA-processing protein DprA [Povalibacter sp.]
MDELTASLTLARAPAFHAGTAGPLLQQFGSAAALVSSPPSSLREAGIDDRLIAYLRSPPRREIDNDLCWLEPSDRHFVTWGSEHYPRLLAELSDAPYALYVRGDASLLSMPQLAMVGARNPTPAGSETAHGFAAHLVRCGLTVTSGLAIGIDTASHRGALAGEGQTIAVCGTGLDVIYPRSNAALAGKIAAQGALVSEFPLGTRPFKQNFPRRNRIISGLSLGTLVVEAAVQSGSLITARLASEQGREVFAIPGSIHNPLARGCHRLIRQGAKLVETAEDIFDELRPLARLLQMPTFLPQEESSRRKPEISGNSGPRLDKGYEILLDALGFEPTGVDLLVVRTGLRADEVASMLLILELEGHVLSHPGGLYVRVSPRQ